MDVTLHALRKVVVDDLHDTLEVHTPGHHFCAYHNPAFAPPHPSNCILPFFFRHTRMKAIDIRNAIDHQLLRQRRSPRLS